MRFAIISDIHSNIHALRAVLGELVERGIHDLIVCAGDTVGYGAFPNECCREMAAVSKHTVIGNHDHAALERDTAFMNPFAAEAALWTASHLNGDSTSWLRSLKLEARFTADDMKVTMYHGSVGSNTEYIFEDDASESLITKARCDLLVLGHTHVPYVKKHRAGMIVNPGSVGQPRDGDPRASFALVDSESRSCELIRLEYDIDGAAAGIRSAGLPTFLAERLLRGQ